MSIHYISAQRLLRETWSGQLPDLYDYPARLDIATLRSMRVLVLTVTSRVKREDVVQKHHRRPHGAVASRGMLVNPFEVPSKAQYQSSTALLKHREFYRSELSNSRHNTDSPTPCIHPYQRIALSEAEGRVRAYVTWPVDDVSASYLGNHYSRLFVYYTV